MSALIASALLIIGSIFCLVAAVGILNTQRMSALERRREFGVLMAIGQGERPAEWAAEVLDVRDRTLGGVTASPYGLYFVAAYYDPDFDLPAPSPPPVFG